MRGNLFWTVCLLLTGALLLPACGSEPANGPQANDNAQSCSETPPAELSAYGHGCALAAEMQAVADTLASVTDQASADRAVPLLRKSGQRLKALKTVRLKLNDDPQAGAKGALVGMSTPAMSAASRKIVEESIRLAQESPHLFPTINSAMEDLEF